MEGCPTASGFEDISETAIYEQTTAADKKLGVSHSLIGYSAAVRVIGDKTHGGHFHVIVLDPRNKTVTLQSYGKKRLNEANASYMKQEERIRRGEPIQAVLVSAGPIDLLKRAYPNYFFDTGEFVHALKVIRKQV